MCDEVALPSELAPELERAAIDLAGRVAEVSGAVGVLAVELFLVGGDAAQPALMVNEIAPRVHNSGHLTSDACATSQFEQHLRAVLDWPLGPTNAVVAAATMVNVVGGADDDPRDRQAVALGSVPEAHVHLYGKTPRAGRKIGHVTVTGDDVEVTGRRARLAADLLAGGD
jgi:5-(carboxyamino)imidazole ribonucleotide synthase